MSVREIKQVRVREREREMERDRERGERERESHVGVGDQAGARSPSGWLRSPSVRTSVSSHWICQRELLAPAL